MTEDYSPDAEITGSTPDPRGDRVRIVVWTILSLALVAFLAFGSVDARIWRFGRLHVESKSIATIWRIQGDSLPQVSRQWMMETLFYGSIVVFVVCVVLGMRLLIDEARNERIPAADERP